MTVIAAWARAFFVTQLVEVPIYRYGYGAPLPVAFAASAFTHPIVWFVFFGPIGALVPLDYVPRTLVAELFAWLAEAASIAALTRRPHALGWALVANAASVAVGLASRAAFGFP